MEWYKIGKTLGTVPVSQQWRWSVPHWLFLQNSPVLRGKIPSKQVTTLNKHDVPTKGLSVESKQGLQWNDYTEEFMKILLFSLLWTDRKTNYEQIDLETHAQAFLSLLTISISLEKGTSTVVLYRNRKHTARGLSVVLLKQAVCQRPGDFCLREQKSPEDLSWFSLSQCFLSLSDEVCDWRGFVTGLM